MMLRRFARFVALAWIAAGVADAQAPPRGDRQAVSFIGARILIRYESGLEVEASYPSATELKWKTVKGPQPGATGSENIQSLEIVPGVFFLNWVEKGGVTVSQVLDLGKKTSFAFVTFESPSGRQGRLDRGTVTELAP